MPNLNRVTLMGHLGRDPETRYTPNGKAVSNLSVATTDRYKDGDEWKETTEWHRITAWGKTAELSSQLHKGDSVYVEGKLQTRKWQDKEGNDRYTTEIIASTVWPLGKLAAEAKADTPAKADPAPSKGGFDDLESDVPF